MSNLEPFSKARQLGGGERGKKLAEKRSKLRRLGHNSTLAAPTEPMKAMSDKRKAVYRDSYLPKRKAFLEARPWCEMNIRGVCPSSRHEATEIQHMIQRSLDPSIENLLDEAHWLPSCHDANTWAGVHPVEARLLGVELSPLEREEGNERA